jgi:hypothetical protein
MIAIDMIGREVKSRVALSVFYNLLHLFFFITIIINIKIRGY